MDSKFEKRNLATARNFILKELELVKSDVREAYSIQAQMNLDKDYEPSERELKLLEEQPVNLKLVEKLESMRDKTFKKANTRPMERSIIEKALPAESKSLLHFFYIVRLAQQGFFYLISGAHPALEPQAVQYVCDTLISTCIRESRSPSYADRATCSDIIWDVYTGLVDERDEPVAKGFRTTYKDIMDAAHSLIDKSIKQQPSKGYKHSSNPVENIYQPQPPVWFVMPYTSMFDSHMFAMPGQVPTVPFPTEYMPSGVMPDGVHPSLLSRPTPTTNNIDKRRQSQQSNVKEEEEDKKETVENTEKLETENNNEPDDEDRFADPDMSDNEEEAVEEKQENTKEENINNSEDAKASNSWLNFAASSTTDADIEIKSPKRSSSQHYHGFKNY